MTDIHQLWASGFVNRWHAHPNPRLRNSGDTVGAHTYRVMILVRYFSARATPKWHVIGEKAMFVALAHDTGEAYTGDLPGPFKQDHPNLAAQVDEEGRTWAGDDFEGQLPEVRELVNLCDKIDHYLFCKAHAPDLIEKDEWVKLRKEIEARAPEIEGFSQSSALDSLTRLLDHGK